MDVNAQVLPDWIESISRYSPCPELARIEYSGPFQSDLAKNTAIYVNDEGVRLAAKENSSVTFHYGEEGEVDLFYVIYDQAMPEDLKSIHKMKLKNG